MLGRWLEQLDESSLDAVLTEVFVPSDPERCLVSVASGAQWSGASVVYRPRRAIPEAVLDGVLWPSRENPIRVYMLAKPIAGRYDRLCARFGWARANALIRDRVLTVEMQRRYEQG